MSSSRVALVVGCLYTTCDWVVLTWKIVSSCVCLVGGLCVDVSLDWFRPLVGHLQLFWCDTLWPLMPPCSLQGVWFVCRKLFLIYTAIIDGFRHKFLIIQEKPDVMMKDVCSFLGVSGKRHLSLYCIVPHICRSVTLVEACKQVKSDSYFICLRLAKSSYLDHIVSKQSSSVGKHQETYWSIPKSPLKAMIFLHFFDSGSITSSQSKIFSHFSFHFKSLWYKPSFTV